MRPFMTYAIAACLMATLAGSQSAQADDNATRALWALLKKPGHIVLLRHSHAPATPPDGDIVDFADCTNQRHLDEAGRAQARRVGDAFRQHGISRARLVSSQYCRAMETAKLIGLGPVRPLPALNQVYQADFVGMREAGEKGRQFIKSVPAQQLTVMVSHISNFQSIAGVSLSSGELAVLHLDAAGDVVVDGRIKVP